MKKLIFSCDERLLDYSSSKQMFHCAVCLICFLKEVYILPFPEAAALVSYMKRHIEQVNFMTQKVWNSLQLIMRKLKKESSKSKYVAYLALV